MAIETPINAKISRMPIITVVDDTTAYIPVVQDQAPKNYRIKPSDLLSDITNELNQIKSELSGVTTDTLTGITQKIDYLNEDLTSLANNPSWYPYIADYNVSNTFKFNCGFYQQIQLFNIPTDPEQVYMGLYLTGGHFRPDFFYDGYVINWIEPGQAYTDYDRTKWNKLVIYAIDQENKTIDVKWWPKFDLA